MSLEYTYDNNSNITQLVNGWRDTSSNWHLDTESYNYDGLDRLISANCSSWSHTYTYDKLGNRNSKDGISYTINAVNEVTGLSDGTSFIYDDNGNRKQKTKGTDTWDYTYDYANRVIKVEKNSVILGEYTYDGDGKRIQATENSETTTYMYSGWNVLYEENSTGTACYIYGPKGKIAKRTTINGEFNTLYYHTDHLKSIRLVTDQSRNIVTAITYHPFGEVDTEEGSANETHLFTGKQKDETDLYYYGARYYDPELGRFISRDLYRGLRMCPQTLNRYTYCLNNPIKFIDPDGLKSRYYLGDNDNPVTPGALIGGLLMALGGLIFILSLIFMLPVGLVVGGFLMSAIAGALPLMPNSWQEDLDSDGKFETIIEQRHPDGSRDRWVIEEDGTIYQTVYNPEGEITFKWKIIPSKKKGEKGEIYVWDEESGEWLPDQDKNGIPDERESGNNPGEGSGNDGNEGGDGGNEGNNEGDGSEGTSSTPQARGNYYY